MNKWTIVVSVWMAALASAALLTYKLDRTVEYARAANAMSAYAAHATQAADDEPVVDTAEPAVLYLPMVNIVGHLRGTAEMQGTDDLIIGPGTVTHNP
jgi:hypothetical protein